jgi:hypothetical protein
MKRELIPYYITRAIVSAALGVIVVSSGWPWWGGVAMSFFGFAAFLWYAHSGHYLVDPSTPLAPLRRDARGKAVRNQALVIAVAVAGVSYALGSLLGPILSFPPNLGSWALLLGMVVYFAATNWLFARG